MNFNDDAIKHTTESNSSKPRFSFSQARSLIEGLGVPKAWVYWTDFLASILLGHLAFGFIVHFVAKWLRGDVFGMGAGRSLRCNRACLHAGTDVHSRTGSFASPRFCRFSDRLESIVWNFDVRTFVSVLPARRSPSSQALWHPSRRRIFVVIMVA